MSHTPGPWTFSGNTLIQDKGNRLHIGTFSESPGLGYAASANARLIAAAPVMLAALREIACYDPTKLDAATLGNIARRALAVASAD